jgi:hypothetical protein
MTEFEYQCSAARTTLQNLKRTSDEYARVIECLGLHGSLQVGAEPMRNPVALAEVYSRMLVECEAQIRAFRSECAEYL